MTDHILVDRDGPVLTLVMDRVEKRNALTDDMYRVLADEIGGAQSDPTIKVVVLRGNGEAFTAGNDLADFATAKPGAAAGNDARFISAIASAEKPLIAAVQGRAVGVGTTMLLHCDQIILADDAKLSTPFASLGLVPEAASSLLLPARIGHARAFSMLALGEIVEAREAVAWGLANTSVPPSDLKSAIEALATRIALQPPGAVRATKRLMREVEVISARLQTEGGQFRERLQSPEAKEAFLAFAQRRPPDFTQFD